MDSSYFLGTDDQLISQHSKCAVFQSKVMGFESREVWKIIIIYNFLILPLKPWEEFIFSRGCHSSYFILIKFANLYVIHTIFICYFIVILSEFLYIILFCTFCHLFFTSLCISLYRGRQLNSMHSRTIELYSIRMVSPPHLC